MAEVSWIKLKVGMFDDSKIKYIEALPERDTIITVWVKLLTLAGKYNEQGYIMLSENLPYNDEMLANEFNRPINSIRLALQTFKTLGMIEDVQGIYKVTNWEKHQNIEGLEKIREQNRLRKQKQREKEKRLLNKPESHVKSRDSHATDIDKEEDKELEEDKDKEIDKDDVFKTSINYIMDNLSNNLTSNQMELIGYSIDDIGEQADEVVKIAVDYTKEKGTHVGYLIKVLNNWAKENVKTKEDAQNKVKPKQQVKGTLLDDILNEE
ncbi:phage replisome organizer N-terminal domain-containing protein [Staphylococcus taiwanensis]|nr:phage replisome organizer N-terminal domain-containing protein [Staphylococcus taiwanensis]